MICTLSAYAAPKVTVYVNGDAVSGVAEAYIENGRTMVPARSIFEKLGAVVSWDGTDRTVTATGNGVKVKLVIGSRTLNVNGKLSNMDTWPVIRDGYTFVPARAVAQAFGADVRWLPELYAVSVTTENIKTFEKYPAVLVPDMSSVEVTGTSEDGAVKMYTLKAGENDDSWVASEIVNLVADYEKAMENIGWQKAVYDNPSVLFESEFYGNTKSECRYTVRFFVSREENGEYRLCVMVTEYIKVYNVITGEVNDITESEYLMTSKYRDTDVWKKSLGSMVTLYGVDNSTVTVYDYEVYGYLSAGYTKAEKTVKMYDVNGNVEYIGVNHVSHYLGLGYYTDSDVALYSPDGRMEYTDIALVEQRISEGWSTEPFGITLYSHNGDVIYVNLHEKDSYLALGWYEELLVPMYHTDGRKTYVKKSEISAMKMLGWSEEPDEREVTQGAEITEYTTVYITPNGKKYHLSRKCAGDGALPRAYREIDGIYGPCETCVG